MTGSQVAIRALGVPSPPPCQETSALPHVSTSADSPSCWRDFLKWTFSISVFPGTFVTWLLCEKEL